MLLNSGYVTQFRLCYSFPVTYKHTIIRIHKKSFFLKFIHVNGVRYNTIQHYTALYNTIQL